MLSAAVVLYSLGLLEHLLISGIQDQVIDWGSQGFSFSRENIIPVGIDVIDNINTPDIYF